LAQAVEQFIAVDARRDHSYFDEPRHDFTDGERDDFRDGTLVNVAEPQDLPQ
jgi:hypothetical protein